MVVLITMSFFLTTGAIQTVYAQSPKNTQKKEIVIPIANLCKNSSYDSLMVQMTTDCIISTVPKQIIDTKDDSFKDTYRTSPEPSAPATPIVTTSPTETVTPTQVVTDPNATASASLNADVLFNLVNNYRIQLSLEPLTKDSTLCDLANSRAPELYNEIFGSSYMHAGFRERAKSLNYWATENMIYQNSENGALNWWLNSPIHKSAIVGDYKYSCTACSGKSCCQIFTSFVPKVIQ